MFFVGYVDPLSEVRLAVLGFFLNFVRRRRRNGQILDLLGFAAGKNGNVAFLDSVDFGDSGRGVALLEEALRVHVAGLLPPGRTR